MNVAVRVRPLEHQGWTDVPAWRVDDDSRVVCLHAPQYAARRIVHRELTLWNQVAEVAAWVEPGEVAARVEPGRSNLPRI